MRLGAEDRADLVDPLEDPDQLLLVELRALGEVRRSAEVVDGEDVGAALGGGLHQLGGVDLGEAVGVEGLAEAAQAGRGQLPLGLLRRVPPGGRGVVEQGGQAGAERRPPELDGRGVGRFAQRGHRRLRHLDPAGCLLVRRGGAGHGDRCLLRRDRRTGGQDDLRQTAAVADDQEGDLRQLAPAVDPAVEPDLLARDGPGELGCECARDLFVGRALVPWSVGRCALVELVETISPPGVTRPWRCGRGQGRGATTPSPGQPGLSPRAFRSGPLYVVRTGSRCSPGSEGVCQAPRSPTEIVRTSRRTAKSVSGGARSERERPGVSKEPERLSPVVEERARESGG